MTIVEFSNRIGLSTATVSRAFSDRGRISPRTRELVRERAAELGYHPNHQARNMVRRQTDTIGFFGEAPEQLGSDYYVGELAAGIGDALRDSRKYLQTFAVPPGASIAPAAMIDLVLSRGIDGFIVNLRQPWTEDLLAAASHKSIPCVIIDNTRPADAMTLSIGDQIELASRRAGEYLARSGRRQPAMIRGIHDERKLDGFRAGLGDLGHRLAIHPGGTTFAAASHAMTDLLRDCPAVDCLFCANDVLAIGAIRAALDAGRQVPADLAVIGCDDLAMARFMEPPLTTIRLPKYDLGTWAVRKLLALLDGQPLATHPSLECSLILRHSA